MNVIAQTRKRNLGATVAALIAAGFVGVLALILMSGAADNVALSVNEPGLPQAARYPLVTEKFAPGRIVADEPETTMAYPALCHGEGLLDPKIRVALLAAVGSIADYCNGDAKAQPAGGADATDWEMLPTYPAPCHGEVEVVPMDPMTVQQYSGEKCASGTRSTSGQDARPFSPEGEGLIP